MLMLGNLERGQGDVDAAQTAFNRAVDSGDADIGPKTAFNFGIMLYQESDVRGARIAFKYFADTGHPDASPPAVFNLGVLLAETATWTARETLTSGAIGNAEITKDAMRRTLQLGIQLA
jgi:hypothetical protein